MRNLKEYAADVFIPMEYELNSEEENDLFIDGVKDQLNINQILYKAGFKAGKQCYEDEIGDSIYVAVHSGNTVRILFRDLVRSMERVFDMDSDDELIKIARTTMKEYESSINFILQQWEDADK